ncbi:DUF5949 family protein [Phytomonospora sp. NPDC050363]|uniref:DUF5949 family protein n=1 Tax=Phytomonospora sp. NPDC050363 TaxID=3155642 RepID=UPI0033CD141E
MTTPADRPPATPSTGQLGALITYGWAAEAPTGREEAFVMLYTAGTNQADPRDTMPRFAAAIGATDAHAGRPPARIDPALARIITTPHTVTIHVGDTQFTRPSHPEWHALAARSGMAILVVSYLPADAAVSEGIYADQVTDSGQYAIGLTSAVAG